MPVTTINSMAEFHTIINSGKVVVIDFWASWCGPCRAISPVFEKLSDDNDGVEFYKVDIDAQEQIAMEVGIRSVPTFAAFKNGEKLQDLLGANSAGLQTLITKISTL